MNLAHKNLTWIFAICLVLNLTIPIFWPGSQLVYFTPFLIISFYQKALNSVVWYALGCGLILDLLSSREHLGFYALSYVLASLILYKQRRHFFGDSLITLPLMTFLFSVVTSLIQIILIYSFERNLQLSIKWLATDIIVLPILDSAYAFVCFILPSLIFGKRVRKGSEYFSN